MIFLRVAENFASCCTFLVCEAHLENVDRPYDYCFDELVSSLFVVLLKEEQVLIQLLSALGTTSDGPDHLLSN
jgi:hypothetical protein